MIAAWVGSWALACGEPGDETATAGETGSEETEAQEPTSGGTEEGLDRSPVAQVCGPGEAPSDPYVDCVESFHPGEASFGHAGLPGVVLGPPLGGGPQTGGLDVVSLGCDGTITLYFDEPAIVDGPGPDLIVFENPFMAGSTKFIEPARVLVSADGVDWRSFPCDPSEGLPVGCAGLSPVLSNPNNGIEASDPAAAGGDAFDLAEVGLAKARYVRLQDVSVAHYGSRTWCGGVGGGFDLDAVAAVHAR